MACSNPEHSRLSCETIVAHPSTSQLSAPTSFVLSSFFVKRISSFEIMLFTQDTVVAFREAVVRHRKKAVLNGEIDKELGTELPPPYTEEELCDYERKLGQALPVDFRMYLKEVSREIYLGNTEPRVVLFDIYDTESKASPDVMGVLSGPVPPKEGVHEDDEHDEQDPYTTEITEDYYYKVVREGLSGTFPLTDKTEIVLRTDNGEKVKELCGRICEISWSNDSYGEEPACFMEFDLTFAQFIGYYVSLQYQPVHTSLKDVDLFEYERDEGYVYENGDETLFHYNAELAEAMSLQLWPPIDKSPNTAELDGFFGREEFQFNIDIEDDDSNKPKPKMHMGSFAFWMSSIGPPPPKYEGSKRLVRYKDAERHDAHVLKSWYRESRREAVPVFKERLVATPHYTQDEKKALWERVLLEKNQEAADKYLAQLKYIILGTDAVE